MTNQELYELLDRFERSSLTGMKMTRGEFTLELRRENGCSAPAAPVTQYAAPAVPKDGAPETPTIKAPLVGTYYAAPSPQDAAFVSVGDKVKKGQTVCLIEAMKMMSEVPAPCDCVIEEILKENGKLAAFGEVLFRYRPC